jgi:hypothetical protein
LEAPAERVGRGAVDQVAREPPRVLEPGGREHGLTFDDEVQLGQLDRRGHVLDALLVALADHRDQEVHEHHVPHHHHQEPDHPHYVLVLGPLN